MCATCGCDENVKVTILKPGMTMGLLEKGNAHVHAHSHEGHHHHHDHQTIRLEQDVLMHNNLIAERNRGFLEARNVFCVNLVSSPGSGKTTLLEKTIRAIQDSKIYVIEGDQQTMNDANRIDATGAPVVQVNTGNGCHLDAEMIHSAILELAPEDNSLLIIENVGNLVCPAMFDLGETHRVVVMSVTEGEDKPIKYPNMFATSQVCLINKIDLLPYLDFNLEQAKDYARRVNPDIKFIELSASKGTNLKEWCDWLGHHTIQYAH